MKIKVPSKKKLLIILLALTTLIITILAITLLILQRTEENKITNPSGLGGFPELKNKISQITSKDFGDDTNSTHTRMTNQLKIIEDSSTSKDERYDALKATNTYLVSEYSRTNNPEYYTLIKNDVDKFAKKTFPDQYDESDFWVPCIDPTCADTPQPKELDELIKYIESSDLPDVVKSSLIMDLTNTGYRTSDETEGKVMQYLILGYDMNGADNFSASGQNKIIAQKIFDMIKANYPDLFEKYYDSSDEASKVFEDKLKKLNNEN